MLVNDGVIFEIKAVSSLSPKHLGLTLNYLFLAGLHHATMLNFRTERVQHEFVSTSIRRADRQAYELDIEGWKPRSQRCDLLLDCLRRCLQDWGARLDPLLYRDAIMDYHRKPGPGLDRVGGLPSHLPYVWPRCQMCQGRMGFVGQLYWVEPLGLRKHLALQFYVCDDCREPCKPHANDVVPIHMSVCSVKKGVLSNNPLNT